MAFRNAVTTLPRAVLLTALLALPADGLLAEKMVVALADGGTDDRGVLLVLDTETGLRTQLSDFGNPVQGPVGMNMRRVVQDPGGDFWVVDPFVAALFRVHNATGQRSLISHFGDPGQGPTGVFPFGIELDASGSLLVTDPQANVLFRIDSSTGQRTVLSNFANAALGPGDIPVDVVLDAAGRILVSDQSAGSGGQGALLVVDPATGTRMMLSDFGNAAQGEIGGISGLVVHPRIGLIAVNAGTRRIYRVDPASGERVAIADFQDPEHGTVWDFRPDTLAVDIEGQLQVVGYSVIFLGFDMVITVDPATGDRVLLSELAWAQQGATAVSPTGVTPFRTLLVDGFESGDVSAWSSAVGF
jgi:sugar lactone lactonase YvrE